MSCDCPPDPRRTFCPHGRANPEVLRSISVDPVVFGRPFRKGTHDRMPLNSWERGIAVSERPGGFRMPYLDEMGDRIGVKAWGETYRRKFEEAGQA